VLNIVKISPLKIRKTKM